MDFRSLAIGVLMAASATVAEAQSTTPVIGAPARPSSASNLTVCTGSKSVPGTDVSGYDPGTNWTTLQHSGAGFAFIKATEGLTYTNPLFAGDWAAAKQAGVLRGAYHFFHADDDPTQQAQFFLKTMGTLEAADLPPLFDWEVTDGVAVATQIANATIFLNLVEKATGRVPIIYVDPSFFNDLGNPVQFARYPLFIANYDVTCPKIPAPWSNFLFWQADIGPVSGLTDSQADIDVFNGSLQELETFALTGMLDVPTPPPAPVPAPVPVPVPVPVPAPVPAPVPVPAPAPAPVARPSSAANERVCSNGSTVAGLDVSSHDSNTSWSSVNHGGAGFSFIKATEGLTYVNPLFKSDWAAAPKAGVVRGGYHYFHPSDDPTAQAQLFLKTMGSLQATDLPPMMAWQTTDGVSNATQIKNAQIFLNLVQAATGKTPVIFVDASFWNALGNPVQFVKYPLFIANYDVTCPLIPAPWSNWTFWQTGLGSFPGVNSSQVDLDSFNGTLKQLSQFAATGATN